MQQIKIDTEYITLGQLLKMTDIIQSGGMAKWFLAEHDVFVNGEIETRRGRKLRINDTIEIEGFGTYKIIR
jgi:ribosome-associated protein